MPQLNIGRGSPLSLLANVLEVSEFDTFRLIP